MFPAMLVGALTVDHRAASCNRTEYADVARELADASHTTCRCIGVVFIFLTAFWGMYVNVTVGPLG
jgi:uncharacterized membrane protein